MKKPLTSIRHRLFSSKNDFPVKIMFRSGIIGSDLLLRYHPEIEIQFIKKGRGAYYIGTRRHGFARNSILVIKPNRRHRYMQWPGQHIEKYALSFSPLLANKRRSLPFNLPVHFRISEEEAAQVEMIMNAIIREMNARADYWQEIIAKHIQLLLVLLKRSANRRAHNLPAINPIIDKVHDYLDHHYRQAITVSMLAAVFHVSASYLTHLFKKSCGFSIKQYILWRRILEAKSVLAADPSLKAVALAQMVGFKDYALFHHSFRRITGINLSTYRQTLLAKRGK